jgi:hypothetical protein
MLLEPIQELEYTRLGRPLQARVVNVLHPKPHACSQAPLEVIKDSLQSSVTSQSPSKKSSTHPSPRARDINPVDVDSQQNIIQVLLQIIRAPQIPQRRSQRPPLRLKRLREPKLANHDVRNTREQLRSDVLQEASHTRRRAVQPAHRRIRCRSNREPTRSQTRTARAIRKRGVAPIAHAGVEAAVDFEGEERAVRVDGVEVAGALDQVFLGLGQVGQEVAERALQRRRVVAVCPGPAEPADAEVEVALSCFLVAGGGAVGFVVVAAVFEGDPVPAFELVVVPFRYLGMCQQRVVAA